MLVLVGCLAGAGWAADEASEQRVEPVVVQGEQRVVPLAPQGEQRVEPVDPAEAQRVSSGGGSGQRKGGFSTVGKVLIGVMAVAISLGTMVASLLLI